MLANIILLYPFFHAQFTHLAKSSWKQLTIQKLITIQKYNPQTLWIVHCVLLKTYAKHKNIIELVVSYMTKAVHVFNQEIVGHELIN